MVISDFNFQTPFADPQGRLTRYATDWIFGPAAGAALALVQALGFAIGRACPVVEVAAADSGTIGTTSFPQGTFPGGQYRVSGYMQVITPDGGGSTATVTIGWTSNGQAFTASSAAMNGDTIATFLPFALAMIDADAGSPISYSVAYNSIGTPNKMKYKLKLLLENVGS